MRRAAGLLLVALLVLTGCAADPEAVTPAPGLLPDATTSAAPAEHPRRLVAVPDDVPAGVFDPPAGAGLARYTDQSLDWEPCFQTLQCATFSTPLDWSDPDGKAISVTMSRLRSRGPSKGAVFLNPGGPGGSGLSMPAGLPADGLRSFDLVGWDPRGVGESTPVQCLDDQATGAYLDVDVSPDNAAETSALERANRRLGLACLQHSGVLAEHVTTEETVRDLELMRVLLRQPRMNFYGASYGTVIGSMYTTLFPSTSGHLVLDGAVVLGADSGQTKGFADAFDGFARWCAEERCPLGSTQGKAEATTFALLDRLDETPLPVGGRALTQSLALDGILQWLYFTTNLYPQLSEAIDAATDGDGAKLLRLADLANDRDDNGGYGQLNAAFPAIRCLDEDDDGVGAELAEATRTSARVGGLAAYLGPDLVCPSWPIAARPYPRTLTGAGAPTILVIGTTGDPATPYELAERLTDQLSDARLLTYDGVGHTGYRSSRCVRDVVVRYLTDGDVPAVGTRC